MEEENTGDPALWHQKLITLGRTPAARWAGLDPGQRRAGSVSVGVDILMT